MKLRRLGFCAVAISFFLGLGQRPGAAAEGAWTLVAPMPSARALAAGATVDGLCYVVGGAATWPDCSYSATIQIYDPEQDAWSQGSPSGLARESMAVAAIDGNVYVAGGGTGCGPVTNRLQVYDPELDTWAELEGMPSPRRETCAAASAGRMFVFGGTDNQGTTFAETLIYDPGLDVWSYGEPMPRPRRYGAQAVEMDGLIYVLGGGDGAGHLLLEVDVYDPATDTWGQAASLPDARMSAGATAMDGVLYVAGGHGSPAYLDTALAYDPASNAWTSLPPLNVRRLGHVLLAAGGRVFAFGGLSPVPHLDHLVADVEVWTPPPPEPAPWFVILEPDGTRDLTPGETFTIRWTGGHPDMLLDVMLLDTEVNDIQIVGHALPNTGSVEWAFPASTPSGGPCGRTYQAYVQDIGPNTTMWTYGSHFRVVCEIAATIDVRPGDAENPVNPGSRGVLPVAVLTTPDFDAADLDPATARFGRVGSEASAERWVEEDVDGDGDTDVLFHFRTQATGLLCDDTAGVLTARTAAGRPVRGSDAVLTVGCR